MDLVDEQYVARLEIGEQRREIAGALEHRPRRLPQVHAHLARDDVRERRLAEPRRTEKQHMVERFAALPRGLDEDLQLSARLLLTYVLGERRRAQRPLELFLLRGGGFRRDEAICLNGHSYGPGTLCSEPLLGA